MRFLCVSCNTKMNLIKTKSGNLPDESGSLSIGFECPECGVKVAMLTNPFETQLVSSLGVEIGGKRVDQESVKTNSSESPLAKEDLKTNQCKIDTSDSIPWTAQARTRLMNVPEFVRPMAKKGTEEYARKEGYKQVDEKCLDEAKEKFGM